ncbi:response regulator [Subtercola sp. PAMC28395]|uniref:response regulator n=1 Tax=Subtercola sp. PAMC28395 TaxID=2846775 RepID=UPI001C0B4CDA|nr:response regulator [Subtercola sp. PAMC28395]QWT24318.1 response regulator [Subtercola sp. PAMC28395]
MGSIALVVEDDAISRLVLSHMLRQRGFAVDEAIDVVDACRKVVRTEYDLVMSDYHLPSGTAVDVLETVEARPGTQPPFLLITGSIEHSAVSAELAGRLSGLMTKPVSSEALNDALDRLFPQGSA